MHVTFPRLAVFLSISIAVAACEAQKSSNPLSPTVAGPIAGVAITAPRMVEPSNGAEIPKDQQPIRLTVENATSTGVRPLTYTFEVAGDADFNTKVFVFDSVAPGDGRTSVTLPTAVDPERTYYWHVRAQDGANTGPFAGTMTFKVRTPAAFQAPGLVSPVGGTRVAAGPVVFIVQNATRSGTAGTVGYVIQVSANDTFTALVTEAAFPEGGGQSSFTFSGALIADKIYYWRVRAYDENSSGPWSGIQTFRTPVDSTPAPAPPPPPTPVPAGSCASNNGDAIVKCISAKYPDRLRATGSLSERQANMTFIRDRMIEAAICGGLDVGWNLKRCGTELSVDYMTVNRGGKVWGVDIGFDYDNYGRPLTLQWVENDDPYACYKAYSPRPSCN